MHALLRYCPAVLLVLLIALIVQALLPFIPDNIMAAPAETKTAASDDVKMAPPAPAFQRIAVLGATGPTGV